MSHASAMYVVDLRFDRIVTQGSYFAISVLNTEYGVIMMAVLPIERLSQEEQGMDVFNDQRFLLRDSVGNRVERTFRQIITGEEREEVALRFSYPHGYMDTAALALCSALAQAAFEPEDRDELVERITMPMSEEEFDHLTKPLLDDFSIDGVTRFMQGEVAHSDETAPNPATMIEPLVSVRKGSSFFLNRPDDRWAIQLDQIPLFLYSRATFTEKQGGRGYLAGTSKDMEVRTYLFDRTSLRRSIWLNVLSREQQELKFEGHYPLSGTPKIFDTWLWKHKPQGRLLSQTMVTIRAGLFWMAAQHIVILGLLKDPAICVMTGEEIPVGTWAGIAIDKSSSGVGYGEEQTDDEQRSAAFFFHPNAPYKFVTPPKGGEPYPRHFDVGEQMKLVEVMGGMFFSGQRIRGEASEDIHAAPALTQLISIARSIDEYRSRFNPRIQLHCFGFHMLTTQKSVHGGFEAQTYTYPLVGTDDNSPETAISEAQAIMNRAGSDAVSILNTLAFGVRICTMTKVDAKKSDEQDGAITIEPKAKERLTPNDPFMRDLTIEYWSMMDSELQALLLKINEVGATVDALINARDQLVNEWSRRAVRVALVLFERVYRDYSRSPAHFLAAHNARRAFYGSLYKKGFTVKEPQSIQPIEEVV